MSKIDKLVLLGVLFLVALIFGVSFYNGDDARHERESWAGAPGPEDIGSVANGTRGTHEPPVSELDWKLPEGREDDLADTFDPAGGIVRPGVLEGFADEAHGVAVELPGEAVRPLPNAGRTLPSTTSLPGAASADLSDARVTDALPSNGPLAKPTAPTILSAEAASANAATSSPVASAANATPVVPAADTRGPGSSADLGILLTSEGLEPSPHADFRIYSWRLGDTWQDLARRFYGDEARASLLVKYNEGRRIVPVGTPILVPLYDGSAVAEKREEATPATRRIEPEASVAATHVVAEGESLWTIAEQRLGTGARWMAIYELNRDVLPNENALRPGMRLRLP